MKRIFVLLFILITTILGERLYSGEKHETLKTISKECVEATQVDPQKLNQMRQGNLIGDEVLKEYLFCVLQKLDWMTDCGHLKKNSIIKDVENNLSAKEAMQHCMDIDENSGKNTAYKMFECYVKHLPDGFKATL